MTKTLCLYGPHNPLEHLYDVVKEDIFIMDAQPTILQQLCDVIISLWTKHIVGFTKTKLYLHELLFSCVYKKL